jgi:CyaY protein|tara:strand:+ start:256 stop:588 length:333 start_codon:yes stop_codon:yes gene_type:complete
LWEIKVQDAEFHVLVDELFNSLEDELDAQELDLDIDSSSGILTIGFPNGTSVIVSRQISAHEVWVAARSGGFHLSREENWFCKVTGEDLASLLSRVLTEQLGETVTITVA